MIVLPREFEEYFLLQGRRYEANGCLFLNHSGASLKGFFEGTKLILHLQSFFTEKSRNAYVRITADGKTRRIRLPKGEKTISLDFPFGKHIFSIVKLTESTNNSFGVSSAETDGAFLCVREKAALKIEFIGDSITTGFGTLAPLGYGEYKTKEQDVTKAFPYLTAKALGADYNVIAAGGWPIYKSKYADSAIPDIYEHVDFFRNAERWDFSSFVPDVVVITLGTNDFSYLSDLFGEVREREKSAVKEKFLRFVKRVAKLNANAKIYLLCGFFEYPELLPLTKEVAEESALKNVTVVETKSAVSLSDVRAGHPGRRCHKAAAKKLIRVLQGAYK